MLATTVGQRASMVEEGVVAAQHDVQCLLGRCLLRLQQYEHLLKALVAHHQIVGPLDEWSEIRADQIEKTAGTTLGGLVSRLMPSFLAVSGSEAADAESHLRHFAVRTRIELSPEDHHRTCAELRELTALRNHLVHHFIGTHHLWSIDGCATARDALTLAYTRIDQHFEQLRSWIDYLHQAHQLAAEFVRSDAFHDLVFNGISPDGTVDWQSAGIVRALRDAASQLAVDGWAPVTAAQRWIVVHEPDQVPAKYGCSSWRQVVHESRQFELRYREEGGRREAWYRAREK